MKSFFERWPKPRLDISLGAILIRSAKAFFNSSNNPFLPKTSLPSADAAAIAMGVAARARASMIAVFIRSFSKGWWHTFA